MWSADLTRRLPVELISRTLDHLALLELIPILAVCQRWRCTALAHLTYWQSIKVDSVSDAAIDFFLLRLQRSGRRPVILEVNVDKPSDRIGYDVLPAIALHLAHVEYLCIGIHEEQASQPAASPFRALFGGTKGIENASRSIFNAFSVFLAFSRPFVPPKMGQKGLVAGCASAFLDAISWPAPQLTGISASIRLSAEATGCPVLPAELLMNDAPRLEYVGLRNLDIPPYPPAVLANVRSVLFGYSYNEADFAFISPVFRVFPLMCRLILHCGSLVVPPERIIDPALTANIEHLDVIVHPCSRDDVLAQFACDTIPVVHVSNPASFTISTLLDMLPSGPLHLSLATDDEYPDEVFDIGVTCLTTARQRKFRQATSTFKGVDEMPHDLLRRGDFYACISLLTISYGLWLQLAPLLLPLPQLQELTLLLETPSDASKQLSTGGAISCPRLRDLRVKTLCGVTFMRTSLLAEFTTSLKDVELPLAHLRIQDVIVHDGVAALTSLFKEVMLPSAG